MEAAERTSGRGEEGVERLREARARYFERNGFPPDGGYEARWVKLRAGPVPLGFPNTELRRRAVRLHDLHHVLTGYETSWTGEAEIAAWELASGCAHQYAAWLLDGAAFAIGLAIAPRRSFRAFLRGRRSGNLYREVWRESLLDEPVETWRARLALDRAPGPARPADGLAFAGAALYAAAALALQTALGLAPLALAIGALAWALRAGLG